MSREQRLRSQQAAALESALQEFVENPVKLLAQQTEAVLHELCVELGYCLTPRDYDAVVADPPTDPRAFAELVMTLESGCPPDPELLVPVLQQVLATFERAVKATSPH